MGDITFGLAPGHLTAILFVVFDLIMLTVADDVLSRIVCLFYYKRIYEGKAMEVTSVNLPFVTTFLLDKYVNPINIFAMAVKLLLVIITFFVNAETTVSPARMFTTSTWVFDPGHKHGSLAGVVSRRWSTTSKCRIFSGDNVIFQKQVFNLENGTILTPEQADALRGDGLVQIDDYTMACLQPGSKTQREDGTEQNIEPLTTIVGCSPVRSTGCMDSDVEMRNFNLLSYSNLESIRKAMLHRSTFNASMEVLTPKKDLLQPLWTEYSNTTMECIRMGVGVPDNRKIVTVCMLVASVEQGTLFEIWEYNSSTQSFSRRYPGCVFQGSLIVSAQTEGWILSQLHQTTFLNWRELGLEIVNRALLYRAENNSFLSTTKGKTVTAINTQVFAIACTALSLSILSYVVVSFVFRGDQRAKFNTIDGMLTILRRTNRLTDQQTTKVTHVGVIPLSFNEHAQLQFGDRTTKPRQCKENKSSHTISDASAAQET